MAPPSPLSPAVLAAAEIAGVDQLIRIGGAQAIAALAYHLPAPEVVRCLEELGSSPLDEDIRQAALIALYGGEPWCESR